MKREVWVVEFPSNLGLKQPQPDKEPGVKRLPEWLRQHHLHTELNAVNTVSIKAPEYSKNINAATGLLNEDAIVAYAQQQANLLNEVFEQGKFPFVVGGDCSILLGTALALKQRGRFGLFYLDGHTDFMDVSLSNTGGVGGMAASIVTGNGHKKMTDMLHLSPYIKEEDLWCVGNREYDDEYENEIRKSDAKYMSLARLRSVGMASCANDFLQMIEQHQLDGFWLHIDVDVLNDDIMPCVDSRTPDGLTYAEFNELTGFLFKSEKLAGIEITILDPNLDESGGYTKDFIKSICGVFNQYNQ